MLHVLVQNSSGGGATNPADSAKDSSMCQKLFLARLVPCADSLHPQSSLNPNQGYVRIDNYNASSSSTKVVAVELGDCTRDENSGGWIISWCHYPFSSVTKNGEHSSAHSQQVSGI